MKIDHSESTNKTLQLFTEIWTYENGDQVIKFAGVYGSMRRHKKDWWFSSGKYDGANQNREWDHEYSESWSTLSKCMRD